MLQSYVHIAYSEQGYIVGVKVSSYYGTAHNKYAMRLIREHAPKKVGVISYPVLIPNRATKAFNRFIDMKHTNDIATRSIIVALAEELRQGHAK